MRSRRDRQQLTDDAQTDGSKNKLIAAPRAKTPHPQRKGRAGRMETRRADDDGDVASNSKEDIPHACQEEEEESAPCDQSDAHQNNPKLVL